MVRFSQCGLLFCRKLETDRAAIGARETAAEQQEALLKGREVELESLEHTLQQREQQALKHATAKYELFVRIQALLIVCSYS